MVEDLRRLGGEAGVIAGVALGWLLLGILVVWPSAGLSFGAEFNPNRILPWVHKHEAMFWAVNILGGLLAAVMSVVLYLAAGDRFTNNAPASARIGALFGVFGSFGFGAAALLRQYGMGPLSMLYSSNSVGAVHAFRGMSGVLSAAVAIGEVFTGIAALALAGAMMSEKNYRSPGIVGLIAGAVLILATFVSPAFLDGVGLAGAAVWFAWTAWVMRVESGPAFIKWAVGSREGSRSQRRAA
ncbi:MAG: hypothetical protein E6G99_08485 [Bacillati bacterium ANGP1]|uniref:DUF4386 family protein n=1 Tax=Candidatus Segetimicrobium genomatis TaxID=2569760 RepID=A0A537LXD8_9BACT|nr:MAG: hypothetical protein E6G99_08485 [Terrabacteria group bacterium ANGP1]TMJ12655.1 MAG: hypothetical protein E6G98_02390 [Terrabacteria group bacterium ANGP1]